jgi:cytochrome b561
MLANTKDAYGWLSIALHWLMAVVIVGLFLLGYFMVDLDYYSPWYNRAPHIHESVGLLLAGLIVLRLVARWLNPPPPPLPALGPGERKLAVGVHRIFYLLMLASVTTGYLVSSAGDRSIPLFNWFEVPPLGAQWEQQEELAGNWHRWIGWTLIILSTLHALAAVKHHVIDKDCTLRRIVGL